MKLRGVGVLGLLLVKVSIQSCVIRNTACHLVCNGYCEHPKFPYLGSL